MDAGLLICRELVLGLLGALTASEQAVNIDAVVDREISGKTIVKGKPGGPYRKASYYRW